jgi:platelet-activating factor acetylhydrolase IB subunit beta/gamma
VENDEIDHFKPRVLLLLIGTNNLSRDSEETIVEGIVRITGIVRRKCATAKLVVLGLLPRESDEKGNDCSEKIERINADLRAKAELQEYRYEYLGDRLLGGDGKIDRRIMPDGLHLNEAGYEVAGPLIQRIIEKYT